MALLFFVVVTGVHSLPAGPMTDHLLLPSRLVQDMVASGETYRKPCKFYRQGWCRLGKRCKLQHGDPNDAASSFKLPYASRFKDANGRDQITFRPPLKEALDTWFAERRVVKTITGGKQLELDGVRVISFQLVGMADRDSDAINACKLLQCAKVLDKDGKYIEDKGVSTKGGVQLPCYIGHGTSEGVG